MVYWLHKSPNKTFFNGISFCTCSFLNHVVESGHSSYMSLEMGPIWSNIGIVSDTDSIHPTFIFHLVLWTVPWMRCIVTRDSQVSLLWRYRKVLGLCLLQSPRMSLCSSPSVWLQHWSQPWWGKIPGVTHQQSSQLYLNPFQKPRCRRS